MNKITKEIFKNLYRPPVNSHKGQNGKLTIIGGSRLFHGASLWSLKTASRIVDMVFYSTVEENIQITNQLKSKLYDFICIPRNKVDDYINQSDAVLIGPGLVRGSAEFTGTGETGDQTKELTRRLLEKFPEKKWIIDAGSLQVMDAEWLKKLTKAIITPHLGEFCKLFKIKNQKSASSVLSADSPTGGLKVKNKIQNLKLKQSAVNNQQLTISNLVFQKAKEYHCIIVLKGSRDIVCSPEKCSIDIQGNPGMTKGGTGDILAGLIAAFACKNDLFLSACAGVFAEGLAGDRLYSRVGPYFNASDLCDEIPKVLKELMGYK